MPPRRPPCSSARSLIRLNPWSSSSLLACYRSPPFNVEPIEPYCVGHPRRNAQSRQPRNARLTPRAINSATAMESRQVVYLVPRSHSCHWRAFTAGVQRTLQTARDRETRREPSTCPCVQAVPKLTVRVRFPSPAPHAKSVAGQSNRAPSPIRRERPSSLETDRRALSVPLPVVR